MGNFTFQWDVSVKDEAWANLFGTSNDNPLILINFHLAKSLENIKEQSCILYYSTKSSCGSHSCDDRAIDHLEPEYGKHSHK